MPKSALKKPNKDPFFSSNVTNVLKKLYSRDLGILPSKSFILNLNTTNLKQFQLSKTRSIPSLKHSITWLSIDNVESRFLLASKSDGNFVAIDMFQENTESTMNLKFLFDSSQLKKNHIHSVSCIQWYPIDSGMFFTSGMDSKFKVWDTNNLKVVDEYYLKQKIYSHHISALMANNSKTLIALALDNGQVRFIDLNSGSYTHTLKAHAHGYCVCVQWSPYDTNILASAGSDGRILLWDIRSSKSFLNNLSYERTAANSKKSTSSLISSKAVAHTGAIVGLTYTPDGNYMLSLGKDNALRLWESSSGLNTLVNYGKIPLHDAVAEACLQIACTDMCSPNHVFVPSGNSLLMYDIFQGEQKAKFKGHFDCLNCCAYNSVLNEVYTGSKDKNILVWKTEIQVQKKFTEEKTGFGSGQSSNLCSLLGNNAGPSSSVQNSRDNWSDDEN